MKNIVLSLVRLLTLALLAAPFSVFAAEPTVTDVTAKQRYPWNGLVDISCKVSGIEAGTGGYEFIIVAVDKDTGKEYTVSNYSIKHGGEDATGLDIYENGDYSFLWDAREDLGQIVVERMTVRITLEALALSVGWIVSKGETYVLAPSHDAAHIKWAGAWRMPTKEELYNLYKKCDWSSTTINGVNGFIVRGRGVYICNSIFLPCGGIGYKTSLKYCGWQGTYWSSSPAADDDYGFPTNSAWQILFQHGSNYMDHIWYISWRFGGLSIRPVQDFSK